MAKFTKWFNEMLVDVDNYEIQNTIDTNDVVNLNNEYELKECEYYEECILAIKQLENENNTKYIHESNIKPIYNFLKRTRRNYLEFLNKIIPDEVCIDIIMILFKKLDCLIKRHPTYIQKVFINTKNRIEKYDIEQKSKDPNYIGFYEAKNDRDEDVVDDIMNNIIQERLVGEDILYQEKTLIDKLGNVKYNKDDLIYANKISDKEISPEMHSVMQERQNRLDIRRTIYKTSKDTILQNIKNYDLEKSVNDKNYLSLDELNDLEDYREAKFQMEKDLSEKYMLVRAKRLEEKKTIEFKQILKKTTEAKLSINDIIKLCNHK